MMRLRSARARSLQCLVSLLATTACARQGIPRIAPVTTMASVPDQFADLRGVRLRYRELGTGPSVVLLHGFARRLEDWSGFGDSLAQNHHVIVLDLRGFGQSSKFSRESDFGLQLADDVIRLLDHLHIGRAHIVGNSIGSLIAANIAARYPNRVASVTLVAFPIPPDSAEAAQGVARLVSDLDAGRGMARFLMVVIPGLDSAAAQSESRRAMAANDDGSLRASLLSFGALTVALDHPPQLPVLIVAAGRDPLTQYSHALANRWTRARLLELPTANHVNIIHRPEVLAAIRQITRAP